MRIWLVLCALAGLAAAAPNPLARRVILADTDPELRRAIGESLKPWRIELIADPNPPPDLAAARARADASAAQFVVWRAGNELIVYDRAADLADRRAALSGKLDPIRAAAAALTVKTLMRLPPPPDSDAISPEPVPVPPVASTSPTGWELRFEIGGGPQIAFGLETYVAMRLTLAAATRPWSDRRWWIGVLADLGGDVAIDHASFRGAWSDSAVLPIASGSWQWGALELEPWAGLGIERSQLEGTEMTLFRVERTTLMTLRGGATARLRSGRWSAAIVTGLAFAPGAPTYARTSSPMPIFEVPGFGIVGGVVIAVDVAP